MKWMRRRHSAADKAFFRAIEHERNKKRRLLADPYAKSFLPFHRKCLVWLSGLPVVRNSVLYYVDLRWPDARSTCIARTRLIDNMLLNAIRHSGVNQVMILGGGYDCRPQRLSQDKQPFFIEIDQPRLQQPKRNLINRIKGRPTTVDYIPIDFHTQTPADVVPAIVQRDHYKTLFICEGDASLPAIRTVFQYIKQFPAGTRTIFTYVDPLPQSNPGMFFGADTMIYAPKGTEKRYGILPEQVGTFLQEFNMDLLFDADATTYRRHCFGSDHPSLSKHEQVRVALAQVK